MALPSSAPYTLFDANLVKRALEYLYVFHDDDDGTTD